MTTTGMLRRLASATGGASAASSSGASTMPATPRLTKPSTSDTCDARSSSRNGPRQMIVAPISLAAFSAPAWMLCQKTCEVPFGITAIVGPLVLRGVHATSTASRQNVAQGFSPATTAALKRCATYCPTRHPQLQVPEPDCVSAEHGVAFVRCADGEVVGHHRHRAAVVARNRTDGPVGS